MKAVHVSLKRNTVFQESDFMSIAFYYTAKIFILETLLFPEALWVAASRFHMKFLFAIEFFSAPSEQWNGRQQYH